MTGIVMSYMATVKSAVTTGTSIYNLLSPAGQTAYNNTSSGFFFYVTATDYNAVLNGLSGAKTVGMTTAQLSEVGSAFSGGFAISLPSSVSSVTSNSYIVGFAMRLYNQVSSNIKFLTSSTFTAGTYTQVANTVSSGVYSPTISYFLRKQPTAVSTTTYVAFQCDKNFSEGTTIYTNAAYSSGNNGSWTGYSAVMPVFQTLITNVQPTS